MVYVTADDRPNLNAAVQEIGRGAKAIQGDIARVADLDRIYSQLAAAKVISISVCQCRRREFTPLPSVTEAQFGKVRRYQRQGYVVHRAEALPLMRPGSAIVITGSSASVEARPPLAYTRHEGGPALAYPNVGIRSPKDAIFA